MRNIAAKAIAAEAMIVRPFGKGKQTSGWEASLESTRVGFGISSHEAAETKMNMYTTRHRTREGPSTNRHYGRYVGSVRNE